MAKDKKSVLLYCDLIHTVEKMDNETAGQFFKHYLRYINDLSPETDNIVVDLTFESVKQNLKRDLKKWEQRAENSRNNGKLGGRPPKPEKPSGLIKNPTEPEKPVTDTVTVTDNVTDIKDNTKSIDFDGLLVYINKKLNRQFRTINKELKSKYKARLRDGYTKEDIIQAINNASKDDFHKQKNYQYLTPEFFSRATTLDKFSTVTEVKEENLNATVRTVEDVKKLWE